MRCKKCDSKLDSITIDMLPIQNGVKILCKNCKDLEPINKPNNENVSRIQFYNDHRVNIFNKEIKQ